ncbi:hypothetical protein [Chitinophaga arvensicola]|uniref:Uncharacterized protein n=1 Tax=Chitinophaga arvensicola TaxID=29529 RepID=A0A1I0S7Y3_9BACT|nr:hypothetical protein [Chitinophaga arvensicola]SEW51881.1 hypothetical protein SAMN04488122_4561 [Chitinophaga arvensicola]
MEQTKEILNTPSFNEGEWLKLLFLISDTQDWLNHLAYGAMLQIPIRDRRQLFRKTYYLSAAALTHIIERHYYKILRYPAASKFTIPVIEILSVLRDASSAPIEYVPGSINIQRTADTGRIIGVDRDDLPTSLVTVVTDGGGRITTAFPGNLKKMIV